jgi:hypothetical protein
MGAWIRKMPTLRRTLRISSRVNSTALWTTIVFTFIARVLAIHLGIYGYFSSDLDQLYASAKYTMYFHLADSLGSLTLAVVAMQYFSQSNPPGKDRMLFGALLSYELIFGIISGFKGSVVIPVVVVSLVYYAQRNRIPRLAIPGILMAILVAYVIIEPMRIVSRIGGSGTRDIRSLLILAEASRTIGSAHPSSPTEYIVESALARANETFIGSAGVEYAAIHKHLPVGSPTFLEDILTSPIAAFVPRFLWSGKSVEDSGGWYTHEVLHSNVDSASELGMVTYFNFVAGATAVVLGFMSIGIIQRSLFDAFVNRGSGGFIVLFGLLGTVGYIGGSLYSMVIYTIRLVPILLVVQYFLFSASRLQAHPFGVRK